MTGGTFTGTYGTLTLNSERHLQLHAVRLGAGARRWARTSRTASTTPSPTMTAATPAALVFHIAGLNDAPTANPDTAATGENEVDPDRRARQ